MAREWFTLECKECSARYYRSSKDKSKQSRLEIKKFCPMCRKHTVHKERKK